MALKNTGARRDADRDPVLDRAYAQSTRDEPPAGLDEAIRAAARREVHARPRSMGTRLRSWRMPVSIAAILVLSASLVMLMKEEGTDRFYEGPAPGPARTEQLHTPPAPASSPQGLAAAPPSPAASTAEPDRARAGAPEPKARDDMQRQVESVLGRVQPSPASPMAPAEERQPAPPPVPPAQAGERQNPAAAVKEADRSLPDTARMEDRAAPFAVAPPTAPAASGDALAKRADPGAGIRGSEAQSAGTLAQDAARPAEQGEASRRQAAPDADARAHPERREAHSAPQAAAGLPSAVPPAAKALPRPRPELGAATASSTPIWSGLERQPPERWVERIEELRRAGRMAEARELLEEFRKRFPEYPLPAALLR